MEIQQNGIYMKRLALALFASHESATAKYEKEIFGEQSER